MNEADLYKMLHVDPEADPDVITAAYKVLSKKLHPDLDLTGVQEYRAAELGRAYKVLHDPAERKAYDLRRALQLQPVGPGETDMTEGIEPVSHLAERVYARHEGEDTIGETRLDFGRYEGKTLREVLRLNPDYLRWLSRHSSGIRFRGAILKLLAESTGMRIYSVTPPSR
jgi:DnaJ-class molecular chaperone